MPKEYATAGPRAIYPEMCDSRSLSKCGVLANALWPRLIAQADDQGRLTGDAADILGLCFPKMLDKVTRRQVETALAELATVGQIKRYEAEDEPYIQLLTWWDYQASQRRAYPSRHPAPEGWNDYVYGFAEHPRTLRDAQGRPAYERSDDEPDGGGEVGSKSARNPQPADLKSAANPQPADFGQGGSPQHAVESPQRAAPPRAQPRVRGAVPDRASSMPVLAARGGSAPPAATNGLHQEKKSDDELRAEAVTRARSKLTDPKASDDVKAAARFALQQLGEPETAEVDFGVEPVEVAT